MKYLIYFSLFIFSSSCSKPIKSVVIDNPTEEAIEVSFDLKESVSIDAEESKELSVKFGKRKIYLNGKLIGEVELDSDNDYLINPTLGIYYIENARFFTTQRAEEKYRNDYGDITSEVSGLTVPGDFQKVEDQLAIRKSWSLGVDEEMGRSANLRTNKETLVIRKIHRESELSRQLLQNTIDHLKSMMEEENIDSE